MPCDELEGSPAKRLKPSPPVAAPSSDDDSSDESSDSSDDDRSGGDDRSKGSGSDGDAAEDDGSGRDVDQERDESSSSSSSDDESSSSDDDDEDDEDRAPSIVATSEADGYEQPAAVTLESAAKDAADRGPRKQATSNKVGSVVFGKADAPLEPKYDSKVMSDKLRLRIQLKLAGEALAMQLVLPWPRIEIVYYDKDSNVFAVVLRKPPSFYVQHQKQTRKKGTDTTVTKYEIARTFVDDPSPDAIASSSVLVRLTGSRAGCFEKVMEHIDALPVKPTIKRCVAPVKLYSQALVKPLPGGDDDDDGDEAEPGEQSASGDFGPQKGVANVRAFASAVRETLAQIEAVRYRFASNRARDVPDVFDPKAADAYLARYRAALKEIVDAFYARIAKMIPAIYGDNEVDA